MPDQAAQLRRYIIMDSTDGLTVPLSNPTFDVCNADVALTARAQAVIPAPAMRVIDSIHETGPKLVEMPAEGELSLRLSMPGIKIVPEVFYEMQRAQVALREPPQPDVIEKATAAPALAAAGGLSVTITDAAGTAIVGAKLVAFTDFANRRGDGGDTDVSGRVTLTRINAASKLERVYVYPPAGYWGHYVTDTTGHAITMLKLDRIDLKDQALLLKQLYGSLTKDAGEGVIVGIVDSGVDGAHPDLPNVTGGLNCVGDEVRADPSASDKWTPADIGGDHGTHVAGIVAGHGAASGFRGVAPGAKLRSYRVFPNTGGGASNFDIVRAIMTAIDDKCDIINMSLGGGPKDEATRIAIDRANAAGMIVVVAAGNGRRQPVSYPGALPACVAVSAMGREGSFPASSIGTSTIATPSAHTPLDFVADFSNYGAEIDVIGPGVQIVSTLPNAGHGVMDGTSMAAPAVAGFAAYLLAADHALMQLAGADRSRMLKTRLYDSCKPQGFGRDYEGFGLPLPPVPVG